jgi:hypothetical protein
MRQPPLNLPFLQAISWYDSSPFELSPASMLERYERGWRFRGVLAELGDEEKEFVAELIKEYSSDLEV